jgi:hypothetical protein
VRCRLTLTESRIRSTPGDGTSAEQAATYVAWAAVNIYPVPSHIVSLLRYRGTNAQGSGCPQAGSIHDPGYRFPRRPLTGNSVNRGNPYH